MGAAMLYEVLEPLPDARSALVFARQCTETEIDGAVAVCGPLSIGISWFLALRDLPNSNLSGVQLCLNSTWTEQCSEPDPGRHTVYLSIGARNSDADAWDWLQGTGLRFGESQLGW